MIRAAISLAIVLSLAPAARADAPPDATALFDQGIKDLQVGNFELACKELAASLANYADSGTKGALADCYTKLGKLASAWNLWRDLADTAPTQELKNDAAGRAYKLEPRLPRFVIKLAPSAAVPKLGVTIDGNPVADPTLAVALPVDPGPFTVRASAPDYDDWTKQFAAAEGKITTVEVPPLIAKPKPRPDLQAVAAGGATTVIVREDTAATRHSRHVIGASLGLVGIAAAGVGGFFGLQARSRWNTAKSDCQGMIDMCPTGALGQAQSDVSSARTSALVSTIATSVGAIGIAVGAIVYLSAPGAEKNASRAAVRVVPSITPRTAGLIVTARW